MVNLNNANQQPSVSSVLMQAASAGPIKSSVKAAISESTIAQAKSIAAPSTQVNISPQGRAASSGSDTQNHAVNGNLPSGSADSSAWVNTPLNIIDIDYKKGEAERLRLAQTYEVDPTHKAQDATYTLANRIASLQATIDKTHPELSNTSWDFVLKDGKIEVTGNVSAGNKTWLEGKLNGDLKVVQAAKDLYSAVVTRFQYTADNTNPKAIGADIHGYFDNVAAHVNGNIKMRELVKNELGVNALNGVFRSGTSSSVEMDHIARQYLSVSSSPPKLATSDSNSTSAQTGPSNGSSLQVSFTAATPSTQVSISAQGLAASMAITNQAYVDPTLALRSTDPNSVVNKATQATPVDYKKGAAELQRRMETYISAPTRKASDATFTLANQIAALQPTIDKTHPELAKTNWDFVLKDGKIQVTGNVSTADKTWLEGKLNGDPKMVKAAKDLYSSVVTTFQYTADNNFGRGIGWGIHGYFDKVADHINGNIQMRDLVKTELGVDALRGVFKSGTLSDPLNRIAKQYLSVSSSPPKQAMT